MRCLSIIINLDGNEKTLCKEEERSIVMQKKHSGKMGAIALPVALIAAAAFFIVRVVHRRRRKRTVKLGKKENGAAG